MPWSTEEVEAQGFTGPLKVTRSDYQTVVQEIRGEGAFAYVVLEDSDRFTYDTRGVVNMTAKVTHANGDQHEVWFALLEAGIGTGLFKGGFGFTGGTAQDQVFHDAFKAFGILDVNTGTPENALLPIENDVTVTVETETAPKRTTTFTWTTTADADRLRVFFNGSPTPLLHCNLLESSDPCSTIAPIQGTGTLDIEVRDGGLNRKDNERETHTNLVRVFSDSDSFGRIVSIQEANDDSPLFQGKLTLTNTAGGSGLFVQDGDRIYFQYLEPHAEDGESRNHLHPANGVQWQAERETTIDIDRSVYYGLTKPGNKHAEDRLVVTITDTDQTNKNSVLEKTVSFDVKRNNNVEGTFEARQLGPRSGTYIAVLGFAEDCTNNGGFESDLQCLEVGGKSRTFTAQLPGDGPAQSFTWRAVKDATFTFENLDGDPYPHPFFIGQDTYRICLEDPDSVGKSSVTVHVKTSTNSNGLGVSLAPVPSAPVNCPGAHFEGEFSFTTGSTGGGAVSVADGDLVIFDYDDPFVDRDGSNQNVRSQFMRWWQTGEPDDPVVPAGTDHAADADLDIESIQFVTADSIEAPSPPPEPGSVSWTEVDRVNEGTSVYLRLEFEDDDDDDPPEEGAVFVTLRTEFCGSEDIQVALFEESAGSLFYSGVLNFTPGGDCENPDGFNVVPVTPGMGLGPANPTQNVKIFELVRAFKTEEGNTAPEALLAWSPVDNAEISVADGFGNGAFSANLFDRDMLPHFVFAEEVSVEEDRWYNFTFVGGTEWVIVDQEESFTYTGTGPSSRQVNADVPQPIVGGDFRLPHCDFVSISYVITGPLGSSGNLNCQSINGRTVSFSAPPNCPAVGATCTITIEYKYRAQPIAQGTGWSCDDGNQFRYFRTSDGIVFCQDQSNNVVIDYVGGERTITGIGPGGEQEDATLVFNGFDGDPGVPVFKEDVSVWFETGGSPIDVTFTYKDPAQEFDGGPGSDDPDHLRSTFARSTWRPSETGEIRIMKDDFSGTHSGTVFGPAIAVEVVDLDGGHHERRDEVKLTAAMSSDGNPCAEAFLRETGTNTGIFRGVIHVDTPGCSLNTDGVNKVHLTYEDLQDVSGNPKPIPRVVDLRTSELGLVEVCRESDCLVDGPPVDPGELFEGVGDSFFIRVTDRDQTHRNTLTVRVASQSQPIGETITLTRVGSGPQAYFLSGEVRFETSMNQGNGRLFVQDGVEWWVEYDDPMDASGDSLTVKNPDSPDPFAWEQVWDGTVSFDRAFHMSGSPGSVMDAGKGLERLARGVLVLNDRDLSTDRTEIGVIDDPVVGLDFPDLGDELVLVETAHNTGVFIGVFSFGPAGHCGDAPGAFPCVNGLTSGDEFEVVYEDPHATVTNHKSESKAKWFGEGVGLVSFDRRGYTVDRSPVITVYDVDLGSQDSVPVSVVSGADSSGISVNLGIRDDVKDDDPRDGIYRGSIDLRTSSSSGSSLQVNAENDEIEARYQDASPPGTRTATAQIGVGAEPVTTLVTDPATPTGENDWFLQTVTVDFTSNVEVENTFYRRDGGSVQTFTNPITLSEEGTHEFEFWSVDLFEGRTEAAKKASVKISLNDPAQEIESLEVTSLAGGEVRLEWDAVSGKTDPLRFGDYRVYRGAEGSTVGNAELVSTNLTSESFTDTPPAGDNPPQLGETFTYFVRVANEAGRLGPESDAVDALSDRVAPRLSSFELDRTELVEELGEDNVSAALTVEDDADNLADIDRVFLRIMDPFGVQDAEMNMTSSGTTFSASYSGFDTCGVYRVLGIAADAVGNEGVLNESVRFIGIDRAPPILRDVPTEIRQGQDLNVTVVDNCAGVATVAYTIQGQERREVNVPSRQPGDNCTPGPCEVRFVISADRLRPGDNLITFDLADANETANVATIRHTVTMTVPDLPDDTDPTAPPAVGDTFSNLVEHGGRFSFTVNGQVTSLTFSTPDVDLGDVIGALNPQTGRVRVDVSGLEPGRHTATVTATSTFGTDTKEFTFFVLDQGVPLPPINVQVERDDRGRPVITWERNPESQAAVGGYLVHRSSSPWAVIAVTDGDTFRFMDTSARGGQSYQYAVTSYGAEGEGRLNEGDDSSSLAWFEGVHATSFQTDSVDAGIPAVVWWVVLVVLAVLVVVALLYVNRRQIFGSKEEELYAEEYPDEAETPFGEERHLIRCPNCSEDFHVNGERPIVTECPNCGRKGILR